ncbi:MAG: hypothetical protein RIR11_4031, partial [Bacteroidota bacterium]
SMVTEFIEVWLLSLSKYGYLVYRSMVTEFIEVWLLSLSKYGY